MTDTDTEPMLTALLLAIHICKGQARLARRIGRKPQEVWNWLNRDLKAPIDACPFIEAVCADPRVTCETLRPDYEGWALVRAVGAAETTVATQASQ